MKEYPPGALSLSLSLTHFIYVSSSISCILVKDSGNRGGLFGALMEPGYVKIKA